jgi:peptidoglycan/xylan/chitin deacetylase (PgdA/CDA1 family)
MPPLVTLMVIFAVVGCGGSTGEVTRSRSAAAAAPDVVAPAGIREGSVPERSRRPATVAGSPLAEIDHGPRSLRRVALTFDADMTRAMLARLHSGVQRTWYDAAIVHELETTSTPATIFLTGLWTEAYPNVVRRLARNPLFELENHSVDHSGWLTPCYGLPVVSGALSKRAEIEQAAAIIHRVTGITPRYFRFPGGCHDRDDLRLVAAAGERPVGWDVVSGDPFEPDPEVIIHNVLEGVRPGSIVVMHIVGAPNAPATDRALPTIITALRARGYRFVTVRELLRAP